MNIHRFGVVLTVALFCLSIIGCASTDRYAVDDQTIANQIKEQLEAETGPAGPFEIDIIVNKGVVQLEGETATVQAKEEAMQIAQSAQGVQDVKSFLQTQ